MTCPPRPGVRVRWTTLLAVLAATAGAHAQVPDERLQWETLETPHFRIHHHTSLRPVADRLAVIAEDVIDGVVSLTGHPAETRTEVVLTDTTDDANGFATALPYDAMTLYVTAPGDQDAIGAYDDWLRTLVTHEYTHVTHLSAIRGLPAFVNTLLGRVLAPNQALPRWLTEGLAVYAESTRTSAGRLQSSQWEMFLRADVLADRIPPIDQLNGAADRWPHGDIPYLYGSYLVAWMVSQAGEGTWPRFVHDQAAELIPYGLNRSAQTITGRTFEQWWASFLEATRARVRTQLRDIETQGLREGVALTHHGETVAYPRFLADGRTVLYAVDDADSHVQLRTLRLAPREPGRPVTPHDGPWVATIEGHAFDETHGTLFVSDVGFHRQLYDYRDLYRRPATLGADGTLRAGEPERLTSGLRARHPDVSTDGTLVALCVNHAGATSLALRDVASGRTRVRFRPGPFEQVFTPRFSPDGTRIVLSVQRSGGRRDLALLDVQGTGVRWLTDDRAQDRQPVFSPDGTKVYFASDREGVFNIHRLDLATGEVRKITNVRTGAFMPAISGDERTLVYVGYSTYGYDLFAMPLDPADTLPAGASPTPTGPRAQEPGPAPASWRRSPYQPALTIRPRSWMLDVGSDGFGPTVAVSVSGQDAVRNHAFGVRAGIGAGRLDPFFDVTYAFHGARPGMSLSLYRTVTAASLRVARRQFVYAEERWGGSADVGVSFPALFHTVSLQAGYDAVNIGALGGLPFVAFLDPSEAPPRIPFHGWATGAHVTAVFDRTQRYTYDTGPRSGIRTRASLHAGAPFLGNRRYDLALDAGVTGYVALPWGAWRTPHVLALHAAFGVSVADRAGYAPFSVGGYGVFDPLAAAAAILQLASGPAPSLRGYDPAVRRGAAFYLANLEYRFLLARINRGWSTLPIFVRRIHGSVFADAGDAFDGTPRADRLLVDVGGELLLDLVVGYSLGLTFRGGMARGLVSEDARTTGWMQLGGQF